MTRHPQERIRRMIGVTLFLAFAGLIGYHFGPGIPVLWGPSASAASRDAGAVLFEHEWEPNDALAKGDGLGPVFNGRSCVECHFQGGVGGGGTIDHNVTAFEVVPTRRDPDLVTGLVHKSAVDPNDLENVSLVQSRYPVIKGERRTISQGGCTSTITIPDLNPVQVQSVNSTALFGAGWVDRISPNAIRSRHYSDAAKNIVREITADWTAVPPGRVRVLPSGRVGKFGWKAQAATLEEFVAAACANEIGLGNPLMAQATTFGKPAGKVEADLDRRQFRDLVAFVDTLPRPEEILPEEPYHRAAAVRGKEVFTSVGCAICHVPDVGGIQGVYSDFLLHSVAGDEPGKPGGSYDIENPETLPLPTDFPKASEWKTPPLWGVADSAPYFHDGASPTLEAAIQRHAGDAQVVTSAYRKLTGDEQTALLTFLGTLRAPRDAKPAYGMQQVALRGR